MTTSGSVDHSVTRNNLLYDALALAGAVGPEDTPSATQITHAARMLNNVVKAFSAYNIALWARTTGYVLPIGNTNSTTIGPAGGHVTTSFTQTTLSAAASSGAATITVTSATGFANGYYVGVELSDGSVHWTTVNGAPSGTTITLAATLSGAASSGGYVYVYQTKMNRPIKIIDCYLHNQTTGSDIPVEVLAKSQYDMLGYKPSTGTQNMVVYDPQLDNGVLYFYPRFFDGKRVLTIIAQRPFEDFDAAADTPDFPQEWYDFFTLKLAVRLAPTYGLPVQDRAQLRAEAKEALDLALGNEPEEGSFYIQPDSR